MNSIPSIFPNGAKAAVSMTYDDGLDAHLDRAIPDLEAANLRGTFYVPTRTPPPANCWSTRVGEWRSAAERGHEVGNHSQYHPCSAAWAKPNFKLEAYSLARMEQELAAANTELRAGTGIDTPRSYAYPCSQDFVGPDRQSFKPIADRLFPASRTGSRRRIIDPMDLDFAAVPSWKMDVETDIDQALSFVDDTIEAGGWAVFMFHGVGGGHTINVSHEFHRQVCKHIAMHNDEIWCSTFVQVAMHIRASTRRPWKP
ncbi:MAG TPA: polysaccharide deacetylase family protein [Tepidisphaeraceae bacterium]|nr:polysaccharide deacetylase family protein [Tepidisphaeraceae bacterium]